MPQGVVVVDRSHPAGLPPYCVHGETFCVRCGHSCWLGDETIKVVKAGVAPLCHECAVALRDQGVIPPGVPQRHVEDHRGPHG